MLEKVKNTEKQGINETANSQVLLCIQCDLKIITNNFQKHIDAEHLNNYEKGFKIPKDF